jgi:GNAT superfamily N-acetyltransferase
LCVDAFSFETTDDPPGEACDILLQGLIRMNEPMLGPRDVRPIGVFARSDGRLEGGLVGETGRGMLYIDLLWVRPERRGAGLGSRLLRMAEAEAEARACNGVWLDTYDYQARPFYERHGYAVFGELGGFANGHVRFFMSKHF